jgi:hypothetical protein
MLPPVAARKESAGKRRDVMRRTRKDFPASERNGLVANMRIEDLSGCLSTWLCLASFVRLIDVAGVDNTLSIFVPPATQEISRDGGVVRFRTPIIILHFLKTCYR